MTVRSTLIAAGSQLLPAELVDLFTVPVGRTLVWKSSQLVHSGEVDGNVLLGVRVSGTVVLVYASGSIAVGGMASDDHWRVVLPGDTIVLWLNTPGRTDYYLSGALLLGPPE